MTTRRDPDQIMRELGIARALNDVAAVERLTAELENRIDQIFQGKS